jgi:phosphoglycerate kinase
MVTKFRVLRDEQPEIFAGKRVLLRLDLNLPLSGETVAADFRLRRTLPTLEFLKKSAAQILVLSHLSDPAATLRPIVAHLNKFMPAAFVSSPVEAGRVLARAPAASITVLENLRRDPGEEENSAELAKRLAQLGEIFVNDAFSASHRQHASIVSLPSLLPSYAGLLFEEEVKNLSRLFAPVQPFVVVLGGLKFSTKLPLIEKFLPIAEQIFIGGALAHSFFKELGYEIGRSVVDENTPIIRPLLENKKIVLPEDVLVESDCRQITIKNVRQTLPTDKIIDCGQEFLQRIGAAAARAQTLLWNGPLGTFESGLAPGTEKLAELISQSNTFSVVGGGDTVAAVSGLGLLDKFSFVSTAGGAMLDFLATGTLPGIEALQGR